MSFIFCRVNIWSSVTPSPPQCAMQRQLTHLFYVVITGGSFLSVASRRCIAHWGGGGAADDHKMERLYFNISTGFLR